MDIGLAILLIGLAAIALGISVCAFAFKHIALSMAAGTLWLIIGFYALTAGLIPGNIPLGIFCMLMSVVMFISPAFIKPKQVIEEPAEPDYYEEMAAKMEKLRTKGSHFRPREY